VEAIKAKKATKRELIVVATMISRMIGTPVFSDRTEFSVATGYSYSSESLITSTNPIAIATLEDA
jgi:hypothetical protein